jgi:hypothetical protein
MDRFVLGGGLRRSAGAIGLDHHQAGILEIPLRVDLRRFVARFLVTWLGANRLGPGLLRA